MSTHFMAEIRNCISFPGKYFAWDANRLAFGRRLIGAIRFQLSKYKIQDVPLFCARDLITKFLAGLFFLSPLVSTAGIVQPIAQSIYYTGYNFSMAPLSCQGGVNRDTIGQACAQYLSNNPWQSIYTYIGYSGIYPGETNPFTYNFSHTSSGAAAGNYEIVGWVQSSCDKGGYSLSNNICLPNGDPIPAKNEGPTCNLWAGNPIHIGIGSKHQIEMDFSRVNSSPLIFRRDYSSTVTGSSALGVSWRSHYDRSVLLLSNASISTAFVNRPDGKSNFFTLNGSTWTPDSDIPDTLIQIKDASGATTGWRYTVAADDSVELYNAGGQLQSITDRAGHTQTLTYSDGSAGANGGYVLDATGTPTTTVLPAGLLIRVVDAAGRALNFSYDANSRIVRMTDPAGGVYTYAYDPSNNLSSVTYPDTHTRTYLYENTSFPHALTGITDENGVRYATYRYDAQGRAYDEDHGSGAGGGLIDHYNLT
ncbi:MAG: DUF6531 domain-containing protein, partial [Sulfuriferula sp.]